MARPCRCWRSLIALVGIVAGLYPAMLLAAYQPAQVLASARTPAGGRMGTRPAQSSGPASIRQRHLLRDLHAGDRQAGVVPAQRRSRLRPRRPDHRREPRLGKELMPLSRRDPGLRCAGYRASASATVSDREPDSDSTAFYFSVWRPWHDPGRHPSLVGTRIRWTRLLRDLWHPS